LRQASLALGCPCSAHRAASYYRGLSKIRHSFLTQWHAAGCPHIPQIVPKHARLYATDFKQPDNLHEYAFEMATSNVRYGKGVTREVGYDLKDLQANLVAVFIDPTLAKMPGNSPAAILLQSLEDAGVKFKVFSDISIEPTDTSLKKAIKFATSDRFDAFVALGGGSTMDTCKAANLYSTYPPEHFFDYVNAPIGKGLPPPGPVKPLIAIPTTAGTGSETTGVIVFDWEEKEVKIGIAHRLLRPILGIIDPNNTATCPPNVIAASGFDVLCHSLESYTAIPYESRPRPATPKERPSYQGSNPISDHWSLKSLQMTSDYLGRSFRDPADEDARCQMLLAATFAGIGFGNGGVHLCHGMSYPVAGMAHKTNFVPEGYPGKMVPHGVSVIVHAPAVFRWTASSNPQRHLEAARTMGVDISQAQDEDAGKILSTRILELMREMKIPNGLKEIGYTEEDIPAMVQGTLPQHRVTKLSPRPVGAPELEYLFKDSMTIY